MKAENPNRQILGRVGRFALNYVVPVAIWALAAWIWMDLSQLDDVDDGSLVVILMTTGPFYLAGWLALSWKERAKVGFWLSILPTLYLVYCLCLSWIAFWRFVL